MGAEHPSESSVSTYSTASHQITWTTAKLEAWKYIVLRVMMRCSPYVPYIDWWRFETDTSCWISHRQAQTIWDLENSVAMRRSVTIPCWLHIFSSYPLRHFLIIKPTGCTNFSNLFLEWNCTCFGHFLCTSSGDLHCTHSNGICHTGLLNSLRAGSGRNILILLASCQHNLYDIHHCCVYSEELLMMYRGIV